jgi:hypothetical protein
LSPFHGIGKLAAMNAMPPPRRGTNVGLIIGIVAGALALLCCGVVAIVVVFVVLPTTRTKTVSYYASGPSSISGTYTDEDGHSQSFSSSYSFSKTIKTTRTYVVMTVSGTGSDYSDVRCSISSSGGSDQNSGPTYASCSTPIKR